MQACRKRTIDVAGLVDQRPKAMVVLSLKSPGRFHDAMMSVEGGAFYSER